MTSPNLDIRVISIGALAAHPLWGERSPVRNGHATTTLIRSSDATILVDPGLPGPMLGPRLKERSGLDPEDISHVFLTSFHPDTHRGLHLFEQATWWISREEREGAGIPLVSLLKRAMTSPDPDAGLIQSLQREVELLQRCQESPEKLCPGVDLFPMPGVTPGCTGLIVSQDELTTIICGDAIPTSEHYRRGMVLATAADVTRARNSFAEACEVADLLIPGRDNTLVNDKQVKEQDVRAEEFED